MNERFPQEPVDLSANVWREVKLTFQGDTVAISVDSKTWSKTLKHACFNAAKRKLLWMQSGGEKGIEIDDIVVVEKLKSKRLGASAVGGNRPYDTDENVLERVTE